MGSRNPDRERIAKGLAVKKPKRPPLPDGWPKDPKEGMRGWVMFGEPRYQRASGFLMCQECFEVIPEGAWHIRMDIASGVLVGCCQDHLQKRFDRHEDEYWSRESISKKDIAAMF